jgi:uncharacterized protein (DUF2267 family)
LTDRDLALGVLAGGLDPKTTALGEVMSEEVITCDESRLIAQLPSMLQAQLDQCLGAPDRSVSTQAIEDEMSRSLGVAAESASEIVRGVFKVISENVSAGQIKEVRGQLPQEMKALFPTTASSRRRQPHAP